MDVGGREEEGKTIAPVWWEVAMFRILNAIMVIFFLSAVVKLRTDDNACLWIPTFLVPAFLSTIVAVKPQLSECVWWKAWVIIHTAISTMLALVWSIQLVRTIHAEKDSLSLQAGEDSLYTTSMNPLQYEEGREMFGVVIIIFWLKITAHVSKTQFRTYNLLPAPRRLVTTALYMSVIPLILTGVCILRCSQHEDSCLAVFGF
eukprot:TRINITY_DN10227_c0_g1_i1.p1 TRINITY_DN10227_c0_g1~~TRINITY_DN10227_c0_g1_i1.p1  ORF type:complete len:231 (-),score=65.03 TRINITY_DN10227_c0_g1_i1:72-680(-)